MVHLFKTAIDPCQTNNGGCHSNATCAYIGPGKVIIIKRMIAAIQGKIVCPGGS